MSPPDAGTGKVGEAVIRTAVDTGPGDMLENRNRRHARQRRMQRTDTN